jgi:hypothetical protein
MNVVLSIERFSEIVKQAQNYFLHFELGLDGLGGGGGGGGGGRE